MRVTLRTGLLVVPLGFIAACANIIGADFGDYTLAGMGGKAATSVGGAGGARASSAATTSVGGATTVSSTSSTGATTSSSGGGATTTSASAATTTAASSTSSTTTASSTSSTTTTAASSTSASSTTTTTAASSTSASSSSSTGGATGCTSDADCTGGGFCWLGACGKVSAISANGSEVCAVLTTGALQCWGWNASGQLGNNSTIDSHVPIGVSGLSSGVAAVGVGSGYACAVTTAGGVLCWGSNVYGELGDGTTNNSLVPVPVSGLSSGVSAVSASLYHACALTTAGGVLCWGENTQGELGNNTNTESHVPVAVTGLSSGVVAISVGSVHACALTTAGGVLCWGWNAYGQLGNGTQTDSSVPVAVSGLSSGVSAIAAGDNHTCALTTAGGVLCWGYNQDGELGSGTSTNSLVPVGVLDLSSGATAIAGAFDHDCARMATGHVECWGQGLYGELGNNTKMASPSPVLVSPLSGATAIAAGNFHTCAIVTGGRVKCWGADDRGELGDGTATMSLTPVSVAEP